MLLPNALPAATGTLHGVPQQTSVGEALHLSGGGFAPSAALTIAVNSNPIVVGQAGAAADGTFTATVRVPALTGHHTVVGVRPDGSTGYWSRRSPLSPSLPLQGEPSGVLFALLLAGVVLVTPSCRGRRVH